MQPCRTFWEEGFIGRLRISPSCLGTDGFEVSRDGGGLIRYYDTFERIGSVPYETAFCYVWETRLNTPKPLWRMAGSAQYVSVR